MSGRRHPCSAVLALVAAALFGAPARGDSPQLTALPQTAPGDDVFGQGLRAYHAALLARRLGQTELRREIVAARVAEAEQLTGSGRIEEAVARLAEVIEHPQFDLFARTPEGLAALVRLGDALGAAGISEPARAALRRVLATPGVWERGAPGEVWARRSVRGLVDLALETGELTAVARDLGGVPAAAPEEVRGEVAYLTGRAREAAGDSEGATAAYRAVTQRCRFWASATYLTALLDVEAGRMRDAERLLCLIADPGRSASTTPVFADERFFEVRDLARLGLGRIAHEEGRSDDARYYYYLVPEDSARLAEALYEAATTRYEKKDYEGARALLEQLAGLRIHHAYEDEAWVLGAWIDLALCRFGDADAKLTAFLRRYEPVRDAAKRLGEDPAGTARLLASARAGSDPAAAELGGAAPDAVRAIASLLRLDVGYDRVVRERAVLERQASGLDLAFATIGDMQRALATNGGVRPATAPSNGESRLVAESGEARDALSGLERQVADLEGAHADPARIAPLRQDLARLEAEARSVGESAAAPGAESLAPGTDLADLLRADAAAVAPTRARLAGVRQALANEEAAIAKDALHRLDLRLSRLLRRARLGRVESVLGRKHALEVEVDAIRQGYLPRDAVDSLDAARTLRDNEEYWPFEGDDWPDEYVGAQ